MASEQVYKTLRSIFRIFSMQSKEIQKELGLTSAQLIILKEVQKNPILTTTQIAKSIGISQSTATLILDKLADKGMIERNRDSVDKRKWFITLTPKAASVLERAPLPLHNEFKNRYSQLPQWQQAQILYVLELVLSMFNKEVDDSLPIISIDDKIE
jgi:DNA-binding MarR family transcriptional regulator